ncbi:MAG TPA: adenylosuccinate lyase family protein [Acidimicrobiia bacterium]|nr:adenylosuccinate lyase family protein [Acidimicrobiia bacterium]
MSRIADSQIYAHLWGTEELRTLFSDEGRLEEWLTILAALADAQAANGVIPAEAAALIGSKAKVELLDLEYIAAETRRTSHSTLGLIHALEKILPPEAAQFVYYGATVQDLTDTWTAVTMRTVGGIVWQQLRSIEKNILELAVRHRTTPMAGRTHGQIGSTITFGFKLASWADEIRRHIGRLADGRARWLVGQLAGSVGTLGFFGQQGPAVRAEFCRRLQLLDPGISWTTSRDRIAEFSLVLAMIANTMARIGDEVYELQRPELGEVEESVSIDAVGSITMPHKRNPEGSEHLVTLGRMVRSQANLLLESSVQTHERDGRGWKAEWVAFPEVCLLTGASLRIADELIRGLIVDPDAMTRNLERTRGYWASESALVILSRDLGKHRAQQLLFEALREGLSRGVDFKEAVLSQPDLSRHLDASRIDQLLRKPDTGSATTMVDTVVARADAERREETELWS